MSLKFPVPPDNSVESIRTALEQMARIVSSHVTRTVQTSIQAGASSGGGGGGGGSAADGLHGSKGDTGPAGPAGATGGTGPIGPAGATGAPGPAGANGASGATGPAGTTGATGPAGATGPSGAGGARTTASVTTASLASGSSATADLSLAKSSEIISITTDYPARVRLYATSAARTADASRPSTTWVAAGAGMAAEVITTAAALAVGMDPEPNFANKDATPASTAYLAITNKDTVSRAITVTIVHLPKES